MSFARIRHRMRHIVLRHTLRKHLLLILMERWWPQRRWLTKRQDVKVLWRFSIWQIVPRLHLLCQQLFRRQRCSSLTLFNYNFIAFSLAGLLGKLRFPTGLRFTCFLDRLEFVRMLIWNMLSIDCQFCFWALRGGVGWVGGKLVAARGGGGGTTVLRELFPVPNSHGFVLFAFWLGILVWGSFCWWF